MSEPDLDKIRRGAVLAMTAAVDGEEHLSYLYCAWIKQHCEELLYEDLYAPPAEEK
jgi:hypothetical protein